MEVRYIKVPLYSTAHRSASHSAKKQDLDIV